MPIIEILAREHDRSTFNCGNNSLDYYIQKQASQDVRRNLSVCYVLIDPIEKVVKGFYTLSSNAINRDDLSEHLIKKLPQSYRDIPTALLGRLAIDNSLKGQGFGAILLLDALNRCLSISDSVGTLAVVVDPIDENAQKFYAKYGFILLNSGKMFLPMNSIRQLVN